jgi:hypothetical protein
LILSAPLGRSASFAAQQYALAASPGCVDRWPFVGLDPTSALTSSIRRTGGRDLCAYRRTVPDATSVGAGILREQKGPRVGTLHTR